MTSPRLPPARASRHCRPVRPVPTQPCTWIPNGCLKPDLFKTGLPPPPEVARPVFSASVNGINSLPAAQAKTLLLSLTPFSLSYLLAGLAIHPVSLSFWILPGSRHSSRRVPLLGHAPSAPRGGGSVWSGLLAPLQPPAAPRSECCWEKKSHWSLLCSEPCRAPISPGRGARVLTMEHEALQQATLRSRPSTPSFSGASNGGGHTGPRAVAERRRPPDVSAGLIPSARPQNSLSPSQSPTQRRPLLRVSSPASCWFFLSPYHT